MRRSRIIPDKGDIFPLDVQQSWGRDLDWSVVEQDVLALLYGMPKVILGGCLELVRAVGEIRDREGKISLSRADTFFKGILATFATMSSISLTLIIFLRLFKVNKF